MSFVYLVLGSGRQGTAAGYDLALNGEAEKVVFADSSREAAEASAERVNRLTGTEKCTAVVVDASDVEAVTAVLEGVDVMVCATPFRLIPGCTEAAIRSATGMVDLGGHTPTVLLQLERDSDAAKAGISIVPDCGMGPGMNNTMGLFAADLLADAGTKPKSVRLFDGGLPQDPRGPYGYRLFFHINGLTNEYDGEALFLRDGKPTPVPALTEPEEVEFPGLGTLEAFVTSGGTSTVPYTFEGKLDTYENKTLRYPGHFAKFAAFKELGLFSEEPDAAGVSPREVYHRLLEPQLVEGPLDDVCVMRAVAEGAGDARVVVDLVERFDPATAFTAMEKLTGWHASTMAHFIAGGNVRRGVVKLEEAVPHADFMDAMARRGFEVTIDRS